MSHTITLLPSGRHFNCPEPATVLKAGLDAGLFMPYSCRSGVCRTCRGKVVEGQVDFGEVHPKYLSEADKAAGYALLCCARPLGDVRIEVQEIEAGSAIKAKHMPARVLKLERAAPDVMVATIGLPMNEPTIFRAGQYIEFVLPDGTRRSYSMANVPSNDGVRQIELHIRHVPGGAYSDYVFNRMKVRDVLRLEMPLGSFFLREQSTKPIVLLASGTGFAPIQSIVQYSLARGLTRPITLYWGGRKREDLYRHSLAESWAAKHPHIRYVPVLSEPASETTAACAWKGRTGFVHQAVIQDYPDMSGLEVYACGAPVVVESARRDFIHECRLPEDAFFADAFLTAADKNA